MTPTRVYNVHAVKVRQPDDVYIGRAGHGESGEFGNPYSLKEYGDAALAHYSSFLDHKCSIHPSFRAAVAGLAGKRLLCFCLRSEWHTGLWTAGAIFRCHGQILALKAETLAGVTRPVSQGLLL